MRSRPFVVHVSSSEEGKRCERKETRPSAAMRRATVRRGPGASTAATIASTPSAKPTAAAGTPGAAERKSLHRKPHQRDHRVRELGPRERIAGSELRPARRDE